MSTNAASDELLYARADQGSHCRAAQIMHETPFKSLFLQASSHALRKSPTRVHLGTGLSFVSGWFGRTRRAIWKIRVTGMQLRLQCLQQFVPDRNSSPIAVFCLSRVETYLAQYVNALPPQRNDFASPHACTATCGRDSSSMTDTGDCWLRCQNTFGHW